MGEYFEILWNTHKDGQRYALWQELPVWCNWKHQSDRQDSCFQQCSIVYFFNIIINIEKYSQSLHQGLLQIKQDQWKRNQCCVPNCILNTFLRSRLLFYRHSFWHNIIVPKYTLHLFFSQEATSALKLQPLWYLCILYFLFIFLLMAACKRVVSTM